MTGSAEKGQAKHGLSGPAPGPPPAPLASSRRPLRPTDGDDTGDDTAPPRRLRVLMVTGEYPPDQGGVADYTRCLSEALAGLHVSVDVLTSRRGRGVSDTEEADLGSRRAGVARTGQTAEAGNRRSGVTGTEEAGAGMAGPPEDARSQVTVHRVVPRWGWGALRSVGRAAHVLRPDIVHIQYQAAAFGMGPAIHAAPWWLGLRFLAARRRTPRTVVTFHDLRVPYLFPKAGRVRAGAVRFLAQHADLAIATNAEDGAELSEHLPPERLALVPIGSNVPDRPPPDYDREAWRKEHGIAGDQPLLAYFGFLNASKGARTLAEALGRLVTEGRDVRLVMIGGRVGASDHTNATYLERFRADLAGRALDDRVLWTSHVSAQDVSAWFHAADVAVLPYVDGASYRRGSLLAALAHGVPVVTTCPRTATAPAWLEPPPELEDRRTARLAPARDASALAAAVADVLDDPVLANELSRGARELSRFFAWEGIARRHAELYARLTEGTARA